MEIRSWGWQHSSFLSCKKASIIIKLSCRRKQSPEIEKLSQTALLETLDPNVLKVYLPHAFTSQVHESIFSKWIIMLARVCFWFLLETFTNGEPFSQGGGRKWMRPLAEVFIRILRSMALGIQEEMADVHMSHRLEELLGFPAKLAVMVKVLLHQ